MSCAGNENADYVKNYHIVAHEFQVLRVLHELGVAAPTPYYLDDTCEVFHIPYLIMEYVEGKPEFTPPNVTTFMHQVAQHLAKIHQLDQTKLNFPFIAPQTINLDNKPPSTQ